MAGEFREELNECNEAALIGATIKGGIIMSQLSGSPELLNGLLVHLRLRLHCHYKLMGHCQNSINNLETDYLLPISLN